MEDIMTSLHYRGIKPTLIAIFILLTVPILQFSQAIIVDHNHTDITKIPDSWITQVKSMLKIHYAHTSHGEQITEGLERLSNSNSKYAFYPDNCTVPQTTQYLSLMDGQTISGYCETYITPDYYWEGDEGLNTTRWNLNTYDINVSLWAWCTQLTYYSAQEVQNYLDAMSQLESEYPNVTFIYMTGNAQGADQNRYNQNNRIREFCKNNNKVLFDFADLDCWYNGQQYTEAGIPTEHPQFSGDEAGHTTYESCDIKASAFWWLLARIAGWDGSGISGGGGGGVTLPDYPPFGSFDSPLDGANVSGSIPVSGWALDDSGIDNVKIFRLNGSERVYIGDATLVEGARPDVAASFPNYPGNTRAGWGYMLLTNFLPNSGNGSFTLYAVAEDNSGHLTTLGSRTITCDNANAVLPFGAIDSPTQGGNASGSSFINWGWVLTPQPNVIPTDGSTINVWIDGVNIGHPVYNLFRSDIASLFPNYLNANGAVGYFYIDTFSYSNGVHTIQWTATDSDNNTDGIGSRYFTIQNSQRMLMPPAALRGASGGQGAAPPGPPVSLRDVSADSIRFYRGYFPGKQIAAISAGKNGTFDIDIEEMERIVFQFNTFDASVQMTDRFSFPLFKALPQHSFQSLNPLPIGSYLDEENGAFFWQPGPGFLGVHELKFLQISNSGKRLINIRVTIHPKQN
jgi:hypothetical protein